MNSIIKGFIIGIGKVMPGVSGSMLAITLGEYNKIIESISNIKNIKNIKYLSEIGIGIILSIMITSKIIIKFLNQYYFATILLFALIIMSGIPNVIKKTMPIKRDIIISIICIVMIIILMPTKTNEYILEYTVIDFIKLIGIGIIDSASSIIPGISGTAILMSLGYYNIILKTFANIMDIQLILENLFVVTPFIIGFIVGTILISKILNILIKKYPNILNIIVTMLMIYTVILLMYNSINNLHIK